MKLPETVDPCSFVKRSVVPFCWTVTGWLPLINPPPVRLG